MRELVRKEKNGIRYLVVFTLRLVVWICWCESSGEERKKEKKKDIGGRLLVFIGHGWMELVAVVGIG